MLFIRIRLSSKKKKERTYIGQVEFDFYVFYEGPERKTKKAAQNDIKNYLNKCIYSIEKSISNLEKCRVI